jgi:hypothetical protein
MEGNKFSESIISINNMAPKTNIKPGLAKTHEVLISERVKDNEDAIKRCIKIR